MRQPEQELSPPRRPQSTQVRALLTRTSLLDAALKVIRSKGYSATTVDDVCTAAGVTKGSFFHHFANKEHLAIAATRHWNALTGGLFASAPYQQVADPRERILAYIDFRAQLVQGDLADVTCLLGTMVQETFDSHPAIRAACRDGIEGHARTLVPMIAQAKALHAPDADWNAENLALYTQAALQGAFILAKAQGDSSIALPFIQHLRSYVHSLLTPATSTAKLDTYAAPDPTHTAWEGANDCHRLKQPFINPSPRKNHMTNTPVSAGSGNSVQLHRVLNSTPEKIWRAFTQPDAFARWLPPNGFVAHIYEMDVKIGGTWRASFTNFTTRTEMFFGGRYLELKANECIAYNSSFDDPNLPGEMTTRVTISPVSVGVEINITQTGIPPMIPTQACYLGWQESLQHLARLVEPNIPG